MNRPKVVLAGGSGFLGTSLGHELTRRGYDVVVLTRQATLDGPFRSVQWDARTPGPWITELEGAAAVVNLVGRSVDCRKNEKNRREILESRVDSVHALAEAFRRCRKPPAVWVQTGTLHIHGDTWDEVLDESSPIGEGFAPMVGKAWEAALNEAELPPDVRTVILRISFVLGRNGGALIALARLARWFLGGTVASGRQYISWIHIDDLNEMFCRAIEDPRMTGIYAATAPGPVTNHQFMRELRRALRRPWSPPTPAPLVHLGSLLLRTDSTLATLGRRCVPTRFMKEGFTFRFPVLPEALDDLLGKDRRSQC